MQMLVLSLHIVSALTLTLATMIVLVSAIRQARTKSYTMMMSSLVMTFLSGGGLLFVGVGSLGRICVAMSAASLTVFVVHYYYRARVTQAV